MRAPGSARLRGAFGAVAALAALGPACGAPGSVKLTYEVELVRAGVRYEDVFWVSGDEIAIRTGSRAPAETFVIDTGETPAHRWTPFAGSGRGEATGAGAGGPKKRLAETLAEGVLRTPEARLEPRGAKRTALGGVECEVYAVRAGDRVRAELCFIPWERSPVPERDLEALDTLLGTGLELPGLAALDTVFDDAGAPAEIRRLVKVEPGAGR